MRYEILEEIGRGGFARVWRARDRKLDRFVAVKRLIEPVVKDANWEQTVQRFRREARAIAGLNHRNIVGVYDVGEDGEGDYIVMELVEGLSLRGYLKEKEKVEEKEAVALVKGIAQGLGYAHKKNLVHRDIKPANVLLLKEGDELVPKIVDFGLARMGTESELSMTGYGMGTPWYMPPEQRRDAKGVNHTADIYALGKTLYELLTGEIPDNVDPDAVSPGMAKVIFKCVKNNPEDRYFSAEEMVAELEQGGGKILRRAVGAQGGENVCPSCGTENMKDAKFCENCGTGLVRNCPECGHENSIHKAFCVSCGTDVPSMLEASEVVGRMRQYAEQKKWSRMRKEYAGLPVRDKLRGDKAREILKVADSLDLDAVDYLKKRDALNEELRERIEAGDFEKAQVFLKESLTLDPHQEELKKHKSEEIVAGIHKQKQRLREKEWAGLQKEVTGLEDEGYLVEAVVGLRAFAERHPETPEAERAQKESERLMSVGIAGLCHQVDQALEEKNFEEALAFLTAAEEIAPGDPELARRSVVLDTIRGRFKKRVLEAKSILEIDEILREWPGFPGALEKRGVIHQKALKSRQMKVAGLAALLVMTLVLGLIGHARMQRNRQIRVALSEARAAQTQEDWPRMLAAAERALGVDVGNQAAQKLRREAEEGPRNAQINQALSEARAAQTQEDWPRMLAAAERALGVDSGNQEAQGLRREAEEGEVLARLNQALTEARSARSQEDWPRMLAAAERAFGLDSGNQEALGLKREAISNLPRLVEGQPWSSPTANISFVWVAPGSFQMGSNEGHDNEKPVREVRITRGFWMGVYEVTQREYEALMGNNPSRFKGDGNRPVEQVSWNDAVAFCVRLTERERAAGRLPEGYVYRLPTEAEWEYAARGGANGRDTTYSGSNNLDEVAWHRGNTVNQTRPVGGKRANELGLHDMSGNVWEWVHDWYQDSYQGLGAVDPTGPANGSRRVYRGGIWNIVASLCRVARRNHWYPAHTFNFLGFRVVLAPQFK